MDSAANERARAWERCRKQVQKLAILAQNGGLRGLVCSPLELPILRQILPASMRLITPGIRAQTIRRRPKTHSECESRPLKQGGLACHWTPISPQQPACRRGGNPRISRLAFLRIVYYLGARTCLSMKLAPVVICLFYGLLPFHLDFRSPI